MNEQDNDAGSNELSSEEIAQMRNASAAEKDAVDALILSKCSSYWRKVAMVVGSLLDEFNERFPNLPYEFMQVRMLELEQEGKLEVQGDVFAMRASEIRLTQQPMKDA